MLIFEVLLPFLIATAVGALCVGWLMRPLWRAAVRRWRIEGQALRIRAGLEREQAETQRSLHGQAEAEVAKWLSLPESAAGAAGPGGLVDPVLRAVLERNPLDERVLELNRVYRMATGRDLLPQRLLQATQEAPEARPEGTPVEASKLSGREAGMVAEAQREVEEWLKLSDGSGSAGQPPVGELRQEAKE